MFNFEKTRKLAAKQGKSIPYICSRLGVDPSYFTDAENNEQEIPNNHIIIIADILDTTAEYLTDEEAKAVKKHLRSFQSQHAEPWAIIASATGVDEAQVTQWCLGRSTGYMEYLPELSELLGIPEDMLIGKTDVAKHGDSLGKIAPQIWDAIEHDPQVLRIFSAVLKMSPEQRTTLEQSIQDF